MKHWALIIDGAVVSKTIASTYRSAWNNFSQSDKALLQEDFTIRPVFNI